MMIGLTNETVNLEYETVCQMLGSRGTTLKISGKDFPTKEQVLKHHNQTGNIDLSLMKMVTMKSDIKKYQSLLKTVIQVMDKNEASVESDIINGDFIVKATIPYGRYCRTVITIDITRQVARVQFNRALVPVNDIQ